MKQKLLDDLIAFLKASPDPGSFSWCDEGDRLLKEVQAAREALVYKPVTKYRLERHYTNEKREYVDGKWEMVLYPDTMNTIVRTPHLKIIKKHVQNAMMIYPMEELRLYHGSRRIRDIESWLSENEKKEV